jgi:hypothetical protein
MFALNLLSSKHFLYASITRHGITSKHSCCCNGRKDGCKMEVGALYALHEDALFIPLIGEGLEGTVKASILVL